jgi:hypothetical protein
LNSNGEKDKKIKNSVASKSVIATENWQPGPISFFSGLSLEQSQAMKNDMPSTPGSVHWCTYISNITRRQSFEWGSEIETDEWDWLFSSFSLRCLIIVLCRAKEGYEAELCDSRNEITSWLRASSYSSSSFLSSMDRQERIHAHSVWSTTAWMSKSCDIHSSISIYTVGWERERDR